MEPTGDPATDLIDTLTRERDEFREWADKLAQGLASLYSDPTGDRDVYALLVEYRDWRNG